MISKRIEKINELIKRELSVLIQREFAEEMGMVVISFVEVEEDLRSAIVYVRFYPEENIEKNIQKLQKYSHKFQQALAKKITTKNIPILTFFYDKYQGNVDTVEKLLSEIESESTKEKK